MGDIAKSLGHPYLPLILAILSMALAVPCLWTGLVTDDYLIKVSVLHPPALAGMFGPAFTSMFTFTDGNPDRTRQLVDRGMFPWWTLDEMRLTFWRPLTALTHWIDFTLWPELAWLMHLHSLFWLGAVVIAVTLLYRRIMGPGPVAGLAALLYAIDDAHAMPVVWITNRNGLLAVFFGVVTILLHDRWRRDGYRPAAILAPVCLGLGVLSNEGAISACGYLFAYAVFIERGRWSVRALTLAPYAIVVTAWRIYYQLEGFGAWGSARYIDPVASPLHFLRALIVREPVLLLGQWALPPSDVFRFLTPGAQLVMSIGAMAFLGGVLIVLIPLLRRDATARFWCLGMVLALVPSCATVPMDRMLLFSGLGAMGLLAQFINNMHTDRLSVTLPFFSRTIRRPLAALFVVVHLIFAPVLLPARIYYYGTLGDTFNEIVESAQLDDKVADQTVIVVNVPNYPFITYLPIIRALKGQPVPGRTRSLAPSHVVPMRLTRLDERTLVMRPEGGFSWSLFRDDDHPFALGETVELTGMSVEVTNLTDEGRPSEVAYEFLVPLEDRSLVWLELRGREFVPFTLPAVGESYILNR